MYIKRTHSKITEEPKRFHLVFYLGCNLLLNVLLKKFLGFHFQNLSQYIWINLFLYTFYILVSFWVKCNFLEGVLHGH